MTSSEARHVSNYSSPNSRKVMEKKDTRWENKGIVNNIEENTNLKNYNSRFQTEDILALNHLNSGKLMRFPSSDPHEKNIDR